MRAYWMLLSMPVRRFPFGGTALAVMSAAMLALLYLLTTRETASMLLAVFALFLLFWSLMSGAAYASLARPEVRMLPRYRLRLVQALLTQSVLLGVVPALLLLQGLHDIVTGIALLLLAQTFGLLIGVGTKVGMVMWAAGMSASLAPRPMAEIVIALWRSNWTWLAMIAAAGLAIRAFLTRVVPLRDDAPTASPLELSASTRQQGQDGLREQGAKGLNGKLLQGLNRIADRRLAKVSERLSAAPHDLARRHHALRAMLMPYDSGWSILVQVTFTAVILGLAALVLTAGFRAMPVGAIATYALVIASMRYVSLHRAYIVTRASLADTYLAMALGDTRSFHRALCDAYGWHLLTAMVFGLAVFTLLLPFVPRGAWLTTMSFAAASVAIVSISGYGLFLLLTDAPRARTLLTTLVQSAIALGCAALIAGPALQGQWARPLVATVVGLGFALGLAGFARREALARRPVFDPAM